MKNTKTAKPCKNLQAPQKNYLTFARGNAKLVDDTLILSLPAGHTCPGALECLCKANKTTGKLKDGKSTKFRCFAATEEIRPNVRLSRWKNLQRLKEAKGSGVAELISESISSARQYKTSKVRIHSSGDFFSEDYFCAWLEVANQNPDLIFYFYTKSLPYIIKYKNSFPFNFRYTASRGGKFDYLIDLHGLKEAKGVFSVKEAEDLGLEIDHDDSHAYSESKESYALLLHGVQPKNTSAGEALKILKRTGFTGYSRKYLKVN